MWCKSTKDDQEKIGLNSHPLSDLEGCLKKVLQSFKKMKYNDLEDVVIRMNLAYNEVKYMLDKNHIGAELFFFISTWKISSKRNK